VDDRVLEAMAEVALESPDVFADERGRRFVRRLLDRAAEASSSAAELPESVRDFLAKYA
jgi:hypothetical protein